MLHAVTCLDDWCDPTCRAVPAVERLTVNPVPVVAWTGDDSLTRFSSGEPTQAMLFSEEG